MTWVGHVVHIREMRKAYKILVRKPRHRWKGNIRRDISNIGWQGPVAGSCEHSNEPF